MIDAPGKKLVLVVDDEPAILRFVSAGLAMGNYEVLTANNGKTACDLAKEHQPDIILLDIVMAPENGLETLARLRQFTRVPVIALTAHLDICDSAIQAGADATVSKPFKPEELLDKIQCLLG